MNKPESTADVAGDKKKTSIATLVRRSGIVLFHVFTLGIPWALFKVTKYGWGNLYGNFIAHALGTYRTKIVVEEGVKSREAIWMRMVSLPDAFYFHWMIWWFLGAGVAQVYRGQNFEEFGVGSFLAFGLILHTRFRDLTLRMLGWYIAIAVLLGFADLGIRMQWPTALPRGVLVPVFYDFPGYLDISASAGMYCIRPLSPILDERLPGIGE